VTVQISLTRNLTRNGSGARPEALDRALESEWSARPRPGRKAAFDAEARVFPKAQVGDLLIPQDAVDGEEVALAGRHFWHLSESETLPPR
jgi:hypothetical protein